MKKQLFENISILLGSVFFYILFWQETMGLNVFLFYILMTSLLYLNNPKLKSNRPVVITTIGTLIIAVLIIWNNSLLSKVVFLISFTAMIGLAKQKELRFLGYGFALSFVSFFEAPLKLAQRFSQIGSGSKPIRLAPVWRSFRISLVPLLVLLLFYGIYHIANPAFRNLSNHFWISLFEWFSWDITFPQIVFFLSGIIISVTILIKSDFPFFKTLQNRSKNQLVRLRDKFPRLFKGMIALKSEYQSGLILLFSLNVLLFIVNILDIRNYWFGTKYQLPPIEMKAMVHEGTYFLIAGLLLAMLVISYFFRKHLNFYPKNKNLKTAGYLWLIQNGILAISLFIKNYRYIEAHDLAYKRIGVLIFLVLVFAGLITMVIKIKERKTFYYLLHRNAWIAYSVFIICSFVNWDIFITKYNLSNQAKSEIDFAFLIDQVSDKNLYQLLEFEKSKFLPEDKMKTLNYAFQNKKTQFLKKQAKVSWLSWNYADFENLQYLETIEKNAD